MQSRTLREMIESHFSEPVMIVVFTGSTPRFEGFARKNDDAPTNTRDPLSSGEMSPTVAHFTLEVATYDYSAACILSAPGKRLFCHYWTKPIQEEGWTLLRHELSPTTLAAAHTSSVVGPLFIHTLEAGKPVHVVAFLRSKHALETCQKLERLAG